MQLTKEKMFDQSGQWKQLETFEDFDNGLSDLIDLWSSTSKTASKTTKAVALAHFKEDLEAAALHWVDNRAKSKKFTAIAKELAEFEDALNNGPDLSAAAVSKTPAAPARAGKKA